MASMETPNSMTRGQSPMNSSYIMLYHVIAQHIIINQHITGIYESVHII